MKFSMLKKSWYGVFAALVMMLGGCEKDKGELGPMPTASFTVTPVAGKNNTFLLTSSSENAFRYLWKIGDAGFEEGEAVDTAYFLLKGTYDIVLRAFGRGGYVSVVQTVTVAEDDLSPILNNEIFQKLVAKSWKLNPNPGSIIVGTDNNPAEYFGGGALGDCQIDDVYTFSFDDATNKFLLDYDANGSTMNGGNIAPNFACGSDRSYTDQAFTFSTKVQGAGIATLTLPGSAIPDRFIGVTDISSNNYRIISITDTEMVLRSGTSTEAVHTFNFIAE